ncbi:hypothetical protein NCAS_0F01480 [Naumovozyma castellii]|uniref:ATP-dependent DNA helicase II subunit 2 n=1 Tax=Naumovozyma castellii TaxID=27288 RepID=G0VGL1_NAUCA|nr:hypothetical protein NCAS_0F01480 [Naumovozyma castellii CBS 4309]CCC70632.1 hypothetical protein NCAS_0F01480 [Naumovozyma castellii CBS 4309]
MSAESTTFIVDVSKNMINNDNVSKAMAYIEFTLLEKCKKKRKTDWTSLYAANSIETSNSQEVPNVSQLSPFIAPVTSDDVAATMRRLQKQCEVKNEADDMESSMVQCLLVASLDIREQFGAKKMLRQIMVFTDDLNGLNFNDEEIDVLVGEIDSRIILVDCQEDSEDGEEEGKKNVDKAWLKLIKKLPGSMILPMDDLLLEITSPKPAVVKPVRVFNGELRLGANIDSNAESNADDMNCLSMKVEGYPATKSLQSLNRRNTIKTVTGENHSTKYIPVKSVIEYEVINPKESSQDADDKNDARPVTVSRDSITKAYRYGADYVVLPSTLQSQLVYETFPGLDIRGFMDMELLPRYYLNSESTFIIADTRLGGLADSVTFGVLVDVLLNNRKVAVARYVPKANSEVQMCVLVPLFVAHHDQSFSGEGEENFVRTLVLNRLPFAEDERVSDFPRLTNRRSTSGRTLPEDKNEIDELDVLMEEFVDSMDTDNLLNVPDPEYYKPISQVTQDTTLRLPTKEVKELENEQDPLRIPAIGVHRQQQVLLEWIHQKVIMGSDAFDIPDIPDKLREQIAPHVNKKVDLSKLLDLLQIKKVEKSAEHGKSEHIEEGPVEIPSLAALLEKGKREST